MGHKKRRSLDFFLLVGGAALVGVVALIAAESGDTERIGRYEAVAVVGADGVAQVTEAIDYDFGKDDRRGIFRDVPGLALDAEVMVASSTAPDQFVMETAFDGSRIKIGNPLVTLTGRHRYVIDYPINVGFDDNRISWNAIGTRWPVSISNVEVHLITDRSLEDVQCSKGRAGAWDGCDAEEMEPGHLVVVVDHLEAGEGVTVSGTAGDDLSATPAGPQLTVGDADDPGTGTLLAVTVAVVASLLAAAVGSTLIQRMGRELVWAGGSADAAFGPQFDEQYPIKRVDHDRLHELASTEFAPPQDLASWQGGIIHAEAVKDDHAVAWLLDRANAGEISLSGTGKNLSMTLEPVDSPEAKTLKGMFGGRTTVDLGSYDKQFAFGWAQLKVKLNRWYENSPYWDPAGERRRTRVLNMGFVVAVVGLVGVVLFTVGASRAGLGWSVPSAIGAAIAGAGISMVIRSWELRIRTPEGSGLWILTESFRRFINKSDAQHVEAAAKQGVLLDYTAWAVALGEVDHWSHTMKSADLTDAGPMAPQALYLSTMAPSLGSAVSSASTAPSSSGSGSGGSSFGGGGGGGVGGGGGGGGGGSW